MTGKELKTIRRHLQYQQKELAKILNVISAKVCSYEKSKRRHIPFSLERKLYEKFDVDQILADSNELKNMPREERIIEHHVRTTFHNIRRSN